MDSRTLHLEEIVLLAVSFLTSWPLERHWVSKRQEILEVFPQNAACHKTMLLLWMNVYTSGNVFKIKTCQKEGAHSEWELQKHGLCSSYCAKGMGHSQSRLNFSLSYCKLSQKLFTGHPCQLVGLCPGVAACYCNSVGHALTALLTQQKILPQNKQNEQAEISTRFVCQ